MQLIAEVAALDQNSGVIRIPDQLDVPITPRVRRLIDTAAFRRLAHISQLGLVSLVYPAATHSRFEHSLGVYRTALLYLKQLAADERFVEAVSTKQAETFIVAALLHDVGHWPFCHPIEDMKAIGTPRHEARALNYLQSDEIVTALVEDWQLQPEDVSRLLAGDAPDRGAKILSSMLSGPIDIDKFDYLQRDSLHAGVPYGRNFDQRRLIGSLCLNEAGDGLALNEKGRTAAEMMVFARYIMFSEVYWHHAVRAATAMLQRAVFDLRDDVDLNRLFELTEQPMIAELLKISKGFAVESILQGLFGPHRRLYKRFADYSAFEESTLYNQLAHQPFEWLSRCGSALAQKLKSVTGEAIADHDLLIDAPPQKLEVQFNIDIHRPKIGRYRPLGEVSPLVQTLAQNQFDNYVKRVRIFIAPNHAKTVRTAFAGENTQRLDALLQSAIKETAPSN